MKKSARLSVLMMEHKKWKEKNQGGAMGNSKKNFGECELCGKEATLRKHHDRSVCPSCGTVIGQCNVRPEIVAKALQDMHGYKYFPRVDTADDSKELQMLLDVIAEIRQVSGLGDQPMLAELPKMLSDKMANCQLDAKSAPQNEKLINDTEVAIAKSCDHLRDLLVEKNLTYGNSALAVVLNQLLVRIDDKLSRLVSGAEYPGDDTVIDLAGYLVLLMVQRESAKEHVEVTA